MQSSDWLLLLFFISSVASGRGYDYRRNLAKTNQASPGIYFDPETGKFKRGNPPAELLVRAQQLREEVKLSQQQTRQQNQRLHPQQHEDLQLPFAKFSR